jgi:hypothetical protein
MMVLLKPLLLLLLLLVGLISRTMVRRLLSVPRISRATTTLHGVALSTTNLVTWGEPVVVVVVVVVVVGRVTAIGTCSF